VLLEKIEDVVGRVVCDFGGESIGQHSHPNRNGSGNDSAVRVDLDVLDILVGLSLLLLLLFLLVSLVLLLLNPAEANEIDGRMLDLSRVEEFNNLGTNVSSQIAARQELDEPQNE
jgi:hypothetical protein